MGRQQKSKMGGAAKRVPARVKLAKGPSASPLAAMTKVAVPMKMNTKDGRRVARHIQFRAKISELKKQREPAKSESFGLLSLSDALDAAEAAPGSTKKKAFVAPKQVRGNKSKKSVGAKEINQMRAVMGHSVFQSNPLATIKLHLTNTIGKSNPKH